MQAFRFYSSKTHAHMLSGLTRVFNLIDAAANGRLALLDQKALDSLLHLAQPLDTRLPSGLHWLRDQALRLLKGPAATCGCESHSAPQLQTGAAAICVIDDARQVGSMAPSYIAW